MFPLTVKRRGEKHGRMRKELGRREEKDGKEDVARRKGGKE